MSGDLFQHAGQRFAAGAAVVRPVRAMNDQTDLTTLLRHQLAQATVHRFEGGFVVIAACQPRLVGGYRHGPAGLAQTGNGVDRAGDGNPLVERLDVGVGVFIDDAVAVEDQQFHAVTRTTGRPVAARCARQPSREISATPRNRPRSWFSSARRLARTAASSALTRTASKKASTGSRRLASWASASR